MFGHFSPAEEHGCLLNITHSWISPSCCAMSDKQQAKLSKGYVSAGLKALVKNVRLSCREQSHLFPSSFSTKCWCAENPRRIFNLSYWQISKARADPFCALFRANRHDQITDLYLMNSRYNASEITLAWTFALPKAFGTSRCVPAVTGPNTSSDVPFSRDCANQTHSRELTSCLQDKTDIDLDQAATATGRCVEMTSFQSKWQLGEEIDKLKKKKEKKKRKLRIASHDDDRREFEKSVAPKTDVPRNRALAKGSRSFNMMLPVILPDGNDSERMLGVKRDTDFSVKVSAFGTHFCVQVVSTSWIKKNPMSGNFF